MNVILTIGLIATASLIPMNFSLSGTQRATFADRDAEAQARDQINKSVALPRGAKVNVRGLNGPLTIETWEGETADIDITITASDAAALARRPLLIEETGDGLTIRTDDKNERGESGRDRGWVRHRAHLRLPRSVNLEVSGINGRVQVGEIAGTIGVSGVNGAVEVAEAGSATTLNGINGRVSIALTKIGPEGLKINGINGAVEVGLQGTINAQLDVHGINGSVNSDFPVVVVGEVKRGELKGTLGSGGPSILVNGINGAVQLRRR
jgi:hypothetical protein